MEKMQEKAIVRVKEGFLWLLNLQLKKKTGGTQSVLWYTFPVKLKAVTEMSLVQQGGIIMKGYTVMDGYMGFIGNGYMLFASEEDYKEYMEEAA